MGPQVFSKTYFLARNTLKSRETARYPAKPYAEYESIFAGEALPPPRRTPLRRKHLPEERRLRRVDADGFREKLRFYHVGPQQSRAAGGGGGGGAGWGDEDQGIARPQCAGCRIRFLSQLQHYQKNRRLRFRIPRGTHQNWVGPRSQGGTKVGPRWDQGGTIYRLQCG